MRDIVHLHVKTPVCSVIEKLSGEEVESVLLEKPKNAAFGDYSTNIAMVYANKTRLKPKLLAEEIKRAIVEHDHEKFFSQIDIAEPGFINFFISARSIKEHTNRLVNTEDYFCFSDVDSPPVVIEFVSANPTGPLHVGHGRGAAFGDSLARILRFTRRNVTTEYYINDVGSQIDILGRSLYLRYLEELGRHVDFPDDHYKGEYLRDIAKEVKEQDGEKHSSFEGETHRYFSELAKERILSNIRKDLSSFNVVIDSWFSEGTLYENNKVDRTIERLKEKGDIYEQEGALWFRSSQFGDDKDRVIVRANLQKTYFASDIAYHLNKAERGFGEMIDIWGADHHGYAPRMTAAVRSLGLGENVLKIILVQFVTLIKDGDAVSMSTRAGKFETLRDVLDEVGTDAARFFYLMRNANSHLEFDLDLAKKTSTDNPVYYVQYAHARICSILREAVEWGIQLPNILSVDGQEKEEEMELMKKILEFKDVVSDSAKFLEPHRIPFYLMELAKMFHSFYNRFRFISDDMNVSIRRISLAIGVKKIISKGLDLIGVTSPERM